MSQSTSETKIAISPKSKYAVTYENNLFKGWSNAEFSHAELTIEPQSTLILDFKVSDNKVLIYKTLYEVRIYDMENNEHIILYDRYEEKNYKITNFLTNGDIIIYKNAVASIYSSNNNWKCTSKYKFDEINIEFGGVANDRLWVIVNKTIHILDLNKFHYQKIPLEIDEKEINIDKITLKISECLIVINIDGKSYIYSNGTNVPIVPIRNKEPQDFDIIDIAADDIFNKYIITKSIDTNNKIKKIDIYDICCWKSSLRKSIDFDKLLESKNIESNQFIYKEVKNNKIFGLYSNKPRNIDIDMSNNSHSNNSGKDHDYILQETNDDNIFHRIGKQLITPIEDRDPFIKDCVIPHLKSLNIFQNVEEHDYDLELTGKDELHIYAFTKLKKIQLLCCYNIKFIKCTIKLYNNSELNSSDIDKITKHTENDYLKKQWISYLLNHKYFLVNYGERLLNSAIKENNTELVETIINKTLEC
ncbi:15132_t:CDS:2 [Rhizophagus irregularis]|nr:15132_t:CDS:2 [Rhizophagus irregularis]